MGLDAPLILHDCGDVEVGEVAAFLLLKAPSIASRLAMPNPGPFSSKRQRPLGASNTLIPKCMTQFVELCTDWWLIELSSWTLAAICMAITIALLTSYAGQPLSKSTPFGLSLNAWLSVLSAITKLALAVPLEEALGSQKYLWFSTPGIDRELMDFERFDDGGRGPIGAFRLMSRTRTRSLASIGSLICILSLALDPFFQQLLTFPSRDSFENRARITRVRRLSNAVMKEVDGGDGLGYNGDFNTAIGTFFSDQTTLPNMSSYCSTTKCTWPVFTTLGVCSQCEDISDMLDFGCTKEPGDWRREYRDVIKADSHPDLNRTSCGWYFNISDERPMLMVGYSIQSELPPLLDAALGMRILNMRDPLTNVLYWNGQLRFPDVSAPITNFALVSAPDATSIFQNEKVDAHNCVLSWCTKAIEASFQDGNLKENIVATFINDTRTPDPLNVTVVEGIANDFIYTRDIVLKPSNQNDVFSVSNESALSARFALDNWMTSFLTFSNSSTIPFLRYRNTGLPTLSTFFIEPTKATAQWIASGNIPGMVHDMADAMTTALRNNELHAEVILGSGSPEVFINVRWSWLAFPLCILGLTFVFLVVTMWQMNHQPRVWKSSSLTVLVHGLSWDAKYAFRDARSMREIREKATELQVHLNQSKEGGTLDVRLDDSLSSTWDAKFVTRYAQASLKP